MHLSNKCSASSPEQADKLNQPFRFTAPCVTIINKSISQYMYLQHYLDSFIFMYWIKMRKSLYFDGKKYN